jgi:TetR/AcrR family transcriptional regulator
MKPAEHREPSTEAARRIVEAAERLFAARGFDGVSIRDIAEAAGVSKANVFHHFANKWELYQAVLDASAQQLNDLLEALRPEHGEAREMLATFTGEHLACMLEQPNACSLFLRQMLDPKQGEDSALVRNVLSERFEMIVASLARLRERGSLRADVDPTVLAMLLLGSSLAYFLRSQLPSGGRAKENAVLADPRAYSRAVLGLLSDGIASNPVNPSKEG